MSTGRRGSDSAWAQMLQQNDEKHEDAHRRLRGDHRELDAKYEAVKLRMAALEGAIEQLKSALHDARTAPIDVGLIVFNPKMVVAVVCLAVSIVGANWLSNQPIRDGLTVLQTQMTANTRIEDERAKNTKDAIDALTKAMEMRRLEIQQVGNSVQQLQRGK